MNSLSLKAKLTSFLKTVFQHFALIDYQQTSSRKRQKKDTPAKSHKM